MLSNYGHFLGKPSATVSRVHTPTASAEAAVMNGGPSVPPQPAAAGHGAGGGAGATTGRTPLYLLLRI